MEARGGITGLKNVSIVCIDDVEKFELHKDYDGGSNPTILQLCALKKSGKHEILTSSGSDEILTYLESELNPILHRNEHQPPE